MVGGLLAGIASRAGRLFTCAALLSHAHVALGAANGIPLGDLRLHPRVDVEGHYVVNPAFASKDAGPAEAAVARQNDFYLAAGPGVTLKLETPKTALSLDAGVEYRRYFQNPELSTFAGEMTFGLEYNREGTVTLRVSDRLVRYADGGNDSVTTRLLHTINTVGVGVDIKPGGGALVANIDYRFAYDYYDRDDNTVRNSEVFDSYHHLPALRVGWKFLPRTAVFLQGDADLTRFPNGGGAANFNSNILRSYLGLVGDVTSRIRALLKAGYGNTFTGTANNLQTVLGQAELSYGFSDTANARLGYVRTVQPTTIYGFMGLDQGYIGYTQQFYGKTNLTLGGEYRLYDFGTPAPEFLVPSGLDNNPLSADRADQDIVFRFGLEHVIREWIAVGVFNVLDFRSSNDAQFSYFFNDTQLKLTVVY